MFLAQQISPFHCFPACLSSFFYDLQLPLEQDEIVNCCPDLFFKETKKEGSFTNSDENLNQVANKFDIKININLTNGEIKIPNKATLFFFIRWENSPNDNHCVRFYKQENGNTYFMNPNSGKIETRESKIFDSWITKAVIIEKR